MPLVFEIQDGKCVFGFDNGLIVNVSDFDEPGIYSEQIDRVVASEKGATCDIYDHDCWFAIEVVDKANIRFAIYSHHHMYNREDKHLKPIMEITLARSECDTALRKIQKIMNNTID